MATTDFHSITQTTAAALPRLEPGDHLDQATFHERYETAPENISAELIGGVVYMPAALRYEHGRVHSILMAWLMNYELATPGTAVVDNASIILADDSEPQPDASLLILPEHGGQTIIKDGYIHGAPELAVEVALSSEAYDLHTKKRDYERYDVKEYLVVLLREKRVVWFVREEKKFTEMTPGDDGLLRSRLFGGLWLDPAALLSCDTKRVQEVLKWGLDSEEHQRTKQRISTD